MNRHFIIAPLVLTVVLAACGANATAPSQPPASAAASAVARGAAAAQGPAIAQPGVAAGNAGQVATGAPRPAGAPAALNGNASSFQGSALPPIPPVDRMVIKNGTLSIMVTDPEGTLSQVDQLVRAEQGIIANQTVRSQDDKTFANLTIQVPPDNFEDTLGKLRELRASGTHVVNDAVSSQDVTEQYVDLDAQYQNLQTTRDAYQKLLDKATAVSDIISLTREVANIQTQMDQIKGRQNLISRQAAVSTINLSLSPVGVSPLPGPKPLPKPAQAAQDAWNALLNGMQGLAVVLIWMGILLPIPAILLAAGWLIYRRVTRPAPGSAGQ